MFGWQDIVALAIVAVAGIYLLRMGWLQITKRGSRGCGNCRCDSGETTLDRKPLVTVDSLRTPDRRNDR